MKIKSAKIELEDGRVIEVEDGTLLTLAHKMIEESTSELSTVIPDAKIQEWKQEIEKTWIRLPHGLSPKETAVEIGLKLKQEHFFSLERSKHAYNEMVLTYSAKDKKNGMA